MGPKTRGRHHSKPKAGTSETTTTTSTAKSGVDYPPELKYSATGANNYAEWKRKCVVWFESNYGALGTLIRNGKHYVPPAITVPHVDAFSRENDPFGIEQALHKKSHEKRLEEIIAMRAQWVSFSADMWDMQSTGSHSAIEAYIPPYNDNNSYANFLANRDPLVLFKITERTHIGSTTGCPVEDAVSAATRLYLLKQGEHESTDAYKVKFDDALVAITSAGEELPSEIMRAGLYIQGLDNRRYAELKSELTNDESKNLDTRPKTLEAAHALALKRRYVVTKGSADGGASATPSSVFVTTADSFRDSKGSGRGGKERGKRGGRGNGGGRGGRGGGPKDG